MSFHHQSSTATNMAAELASELKFVDENHNDFLVKRIGRMRYHSILTDVVLIVDGHEFPAHKNILAASSDYFMAMFSGHMATVDRTVVVQEITSTAMEVLLAFIYQGKLLITEENVEDIFCGSCLLLLDTVTHACCKFIQERLTLANCWGIRSLADRYNCREMLKKVTSFIEENFVDATATEEFLSLPKEEVCQLLSDNDINVPSEEVVFQTLLKWVQHDQSTRMKYFSKLLLKVRLPQIRTSYFEETVAQCELVLESPEAIEIISDARKMAQSFEFYEEGKATSNTSDYSWGIPRSCLKFVEVIVTVGGGALCEFYDADNDTWVRFPPPFTRHCPGMETLNNMIYIVGGSKEWKRLNRAECYNPETNEWKLLNPMAMSRSNIGLVSLNGLLYAVGGYNGRSPVSDVECYSPERDEWQFVSQMNNCRDGACVVSDGRLLYAISGYDGSNYLSSVEYYDPSTDKWTVGEISPIIERREDAMAACVDGKIYVIGGYHGSTFLSSCEELDLDQNEWDFKSSLSSPCYQAGIAVLGKAIYICGGWSGNGLASSRVERYDILTDTWSQMASLNVPAAARTVPCRFPRKLIEQLKRERYCGKQAKEGSKSSASS
ncbi:kelch-like protein diablo [Nematostella vectensis]|uniref:kelch-like protein diablo n=1 Tax=Nematostella vectensis TaxID=45351 RepID=UPI00207721E8|nr:kelch-like protein diablo [Nematostella vectensis]